MRKPSKKQIVPRTRNGGTQTQAGHISNIRSALRNLSRWWKPFALALKAASVTHYVGRRRRVLYLCSMCNKLFDRKQVEVNHIIPVGSLKSYADLPGFCERLFVENVSLLEVVCKECHLEITQQQRKNLDC